jgi:hypothetical protein
LSSDPNPAVLLGGGGAALTVLVFVDDEDELEVDDVVVDASETVETFAFCCF